MKKKSKEKRKKKRFPPLKNSYFVCKLPDVTRQTTRPASGIRPEVKSLHKVAKATDI